jgi:hypothetical protein
MKLAAIAIIWIAFTVMMTAGTSPVSGADGDALIWLTAGGSTLAIALARDHAPQEPNREKAKRASSRAGRFMDSLSDDDVAELRAPLCRSNS